MTEQGVHEHLQHAIYEEVAAVAYAQTHLRPSRSEADVDVPKTAQTVVVGADGSTASAGAIAYAAAEAERRHARLVLVQVESPQELPPSAMHRLEQERGLAAVADAVRDAHPRLAEVTTELAAGPAGPVLVARAAQADLLVVGSHARGALARAVLGSTSGYCAAHASVPTVIVPRAPTRTTAR